MRDKNPVNVSLSGISGVSSYDLDYAHLAELVDALVLGTSDPGRGGSSPPVGIYFPNLWGDFFRSVA